MCLPPYMNETCGSCAFFQYPHTCHAGDRSLYKTVQKQLACKLWEPKVRVDRQIPRPRSGQY